MRVLTVIRHSCQPGLLAIAILMLASGCTSRPSAGLTQFSTIDAILAGAYDGHWSCRELLKHGDFGIGTFHGLDGEMVVVDGRAWQVKGDGAVLAATAKMTTPFAAVTTWKAERTRVLPTGATLTEVQQLIDDLAPEMNRFVAVRLEGRFRRVKTRSVPAQRKPYPPLTAVTRTQQEFSFTDCDGVIVGFRAPQYSKGITVPGYHLHFLTTDRRGGGHLLGLETAATTAAVDLSDNFLLVLPPRTDQTFQRLDLGIDRSRDLHEAER